MSTGNDQRPGDALDTFASILAGCRPLFPPALLDSAGWERLLDRAGRLPRSVAAVGSSAGSPLRSRAVDARATPKSMGQR